MATFLQKRQTTDPLAFMRRITEEVTDLVLEFGGALSGEHGDGLARSEWNQKMFGPVVYAALCRVKQTFDPLQILNPGKVVAAPAMTENLRFGADYRPSEPATLTTSVSPFVVCGGPTATAVQWGTLGSAPR